MLWDGHRINRAVETAAAFAKIKVDIGVADGPAGKGEPVTLLVEGEKIGGAAAVVGACCSLCASGLQ